jgi:stage III sporulation protein AH
MIKKIVRNIIILIVFVLAVGTAIYLNVFSNPKYYAKSTASDEYFSDARLSREQAEEQADDLLNKETSNASITTVEQQSMKLEISAINTNVTSEETLETSIEQIGFEDCIAFINGNTVNVVVTPKSGYMLSNSDVEQIENIVIKQTQDSPDDITILAAK